jgi:hypothetical protein
MATNGAHPGNGTSTIPNSERGELRAQQQGSARTVERMVCGLVCQSRMQLWVQQRLAYSAKDGYGMWLGSWTCGIRIRGSHR